MLVETGILVEIFDESGMLLSQYDCDRIAFSINGYFEYVPRGSGKWRPLQFFGDRLAYYDFKSYPSRRYA